MEILLLLSLSTLILLIIFVFLLVFSLRNNGRLKKRVNVKKDIESIKNNVNGYSETAF